MIAFTIAIVLALYREQPHTELLAYYSAVLLSLVVYPSSAELTRSKARFCPSWSVAVLEGTDY